jgi:hypothetical protein
LVSIFNAVGDRAAALLAVDGILQYRAHGVSNLSSITGAPDVAIGLIVFTGSLVAADKLQGSIPGRPLLVVRGSRLMNSAVAAAFTAEGVAGGRPYRERCLRPARRRERRDRPDGAQARQSVSDRPVLGGDMARGITVMMRSRGHGYGGLDNELYTDPATAVFFADAKRGLSALPASIKTLVAQAADPEPSGPQRTVRARPRVPQTAVSAAGRAASPSRQRCVEERLKPSDGGRRRSYRRERWGICGGGRNGKRCMCI